MPASTTAASIRRSRQQSDTSASVVKPPSLWPADADVTGIDAPAEATLARRQLVQLEQAVEDEPRVAHLIVLVHARHPVRAREARHGILRRGDEVSTAAQVCSRGR